MPLPGWHPLRELLAFIFRSTKRIAVFVIGVALILLGIALIPLPGPFSIPLMVAGLAVLATEFIWAERMLDQVKDRTKQAGDLVKRRLLRRRPDEPPAG
jgi:drug/metabolite transporter (DMT)-like permease